MELEQTVKEILNGNPADLNQEIAELKIKLAAALEQGAKDHLKAQRVEALEAERDDLKQQLDTLTSTQAVPVAVTANVECSIQYDVKAPDMARWRKDGWEVKHYQFVNNDRELPTLAVVMERPSAPRTESEYRYSVAPKAETPRNAESAPVNEVVPPFTEIIIEGPAVVPSMAATVILPAENKRGADLLKKLAQDKPILGAIMQHGADAVIDAMDQEVYNAASAAYEAAVADGPKPYRFESKLLQSGNVEPDTIIPEESEIIEVILS